MSIEITILGSSSATPTLSRFPSAQYINMLDHHMLLDCGEGTQVQLLRYRLKKSKIDYVFISHVHADHILGLPGLIFSMNLTNRERPLHIFGPETVFELIDLFIRHSQTSLRFEIIRHVTSDQVTEVLLENALIKVSSFPLFHRVPTTGFIFEEQEKLRKINVIACEKAHVPFTLYNDLKRGKDYVSSDGKTVISNEQLTFDPGEAVTYAYASDTVYDERVIRSVAGCDLLYHESTFAHDKLERAVETMHTTAMQAGLVAKKAEVKKLLIGHFSARYDDLGILLKEAKAEFENTEIAGEGMMFVVD